jgi:hypothetical protein
VTEEKYTAQIDISAKLEDWTKTSFIAVSGHNTRVLLVRADVKGAAIKRLPKGEKPQFALMAILAYIAIQPDLNNIRSIVLDRDYSGEVAHRTIIRRLTELIRRDIPTFQAANIKIKNIEGSMADQAAREAFKGERVADDEITLEQIISAM